MCQISHTRQVYPHAFMLLIIRCVIYGFPLGVLGSVIHYPAHHLEVPLDEQSQKDIS